MPKKLWIWPACFEELSCFDHLAAKGVQQKESGNKSDEESDRSVRWDLSLVLSFVWWLSLNCLVIVCRLSGYCLLIIWQLSGNGFSLLIVCQSLLLPKKWSANGLLIVTQRFTLNSLRIATEKIFWSILFDVVSCNTFCEEYRLEFNWCNALPVRAPLPYCPLEWVSFSFGCLQQKSIT